MSTNKLTIAIQKSGRLHDDSMKLLKEAGINFNNGISKLKTEASNFPLEIFFLRDDDIPQYVEDRVADIGIVGQNLIEETEKDLLLVEKLGFGKCRLSIAIPKGDEYTGIQGLEGKRIATSYANIVKKYLQKNQVSAEIHQISGSVEIAPSIGLADAVCDIVSSGSTLFTNGLKEVEVILQSEAVMVGNKTLSTEKQAILDKLLFRIGTVRQAKNNKYILLNAPNNQLQNICNILPGMKSPTILPLATEGWSSVHSVVAENDFWDIIQQLKQCGAEGILIIPIEKMIL